MSKLRLIFCLFGFHKWKLNNDKNERKCEICKKEQIYYSIGFQEHMWV